MTMDVKKLARQSPERIDWMYAVGVCCTEMVEGRFRGFVLLIDAEIICLGVEIVYYCARKKTLAETQFSYINQPPNL
jgi:hypothetical protein